MTKRTKRQPKATPQQQPNSVTRALTALGIIVVVFFLVVGGLWAMTPRPTPTPVVQATPTQAATPTRQPTATPRATATPTAAPSPTPAPPTATPVPQGSPFTLTLLHTNDTWGYTRPCG